MAPGLACPAVPEKDASHGGLIVAGRRVSARWSSRSVATRFQHDFFYMLIRFLGVRSAYFFLFFVVGWYTLRPSVRSRSSHYLARRFPDAGIWARFLHTWRLQWNFGLCLVDRAATGITGEFHFDGAVDRTLEALTRERKGVILLSAHTGCWHMSPYVLADQDETPVSVLVHREEADLDKLAHEHGNGTPPFTMIDAKTGMAASIALMNLLHRGELLCIMGDRTADGSDPVAGVSFLGGTISLPSTPYRLASASGAPIVVVFALRTGPQRGTLCFADVIRVPQGIGKTTHMYTPYARRLAAGLEEYVRNHPYQFFNFYNLWEP